MNNRYEEVWKNCLQLIENNISPSSFNTWFRPIVPLRLEQNMLTIQVPSNFFYEYLEEHYIDLLRQVIRKELGNNAKLEYRIASEVSVAKPKNSEKNVKIRSSVASQKIHFDAQLNPEYTFTNFVEGECNRLARTAGATVALNPGKTAFNPLLIYGDSGLGKTHLAHAIGLETIERFPEKNVLYVTADKFQTQFSEATRNNSRNDFMHFYQTIDVLIIDDVQDFAGKEKTQETFFHIFNHLHQSGRQLILTTDTLPADMNGLNKRLLSRFKWGLSAELLTPTYETRLSILKQKIENDEIELSKEVIDFIASQQMSVRELEGVLISLFAQASLNHKEINLQLCKLLINKLINQNQKEYNFHSIRNIVCSHLNISPEVLISNSRKKEIVQARQITMYFSKNLTGLSCAEIGEHFGGKNHATVLYACRIVGNLLETDKNFRGNILEIEKKIRSVNA